MLLAWEALLAQAQANRDTAEVMLGFFRQLITLINYAMHRHLISHLIRQVNSRKSATAGTLHLRRPLMTNRG